MITKPKCGAFRLYIMPAPTAEARVIGVTVEGPRKLGYREFSLAVGPR